MHSDEREGRRITSQRYARRRGSVIELQTVARQANAWESDGHLNGVPAECADQTRRYKCVISCFNVFRCSSENARTSAAVGLTIMRPTDFQSARGLPPVRGTR